MTDRRWVDDIRKRAAAGQIALVCGTGVSAAISRDQKFATWASLLIAGFDYVGSLRAEWNAQAEFYKTQLEGSPDAMSLIIAAQWLQMCFDQLEPGEYRSFLRDTVGSLKVSNRALERVFRSSVPVLTTNYDGLIEEISNRQTFSWADPARIADYHDTKGSSVFHLHGYFEDPQSVILSASDYERLNLAKPVARVLQPISTNYTPVMIGYGSGLSDPNFTGFLKWFSDNFGESVRRIYVLVREKDLPANRLQGKVAYMPYGAEYEDLPAMLHDLLGLETSPATDPPPTALRYPAPETTYATADRHPRSGTRAGIQHAPLTALVGLPPAVLNEARDQLGDLTQLDRFQHAMLSDGATDLRARLSVLVSAVTGTGKTTLARILMNGAVSRHTSTIMVLPTKALVSQELREWDKWVAAWTLEDRQIRVFGASRDYPENDSLVAKGRF